MLNFGLPALCKADVLQMACSLLDSNPTFLASVTASAAVVKPLGVDLLAEFRKEKGWQVNFQITHCRAKA